MFTPTIYFPEIDSKSQTMPLEDSKLHHFRKVLRMKDFDNVNISNGQGQLFIGKFVNDSVQITTQKNFQRKNKICIFIPYLREKNRFRFMVEKLTELNVNKIYIGKTENTQNTKVDSLKIHNWAISALEQSGTPFFPKIEVTEIIDYSIFDTCFDITGGVLKKDSPKVHNFAIGPEGGWSPEELSNFKFKYKLSDFSLRTDTAAISAVSLMM